MVSAITKVKPQAVKAGTFSRRIGNTVYRVNVFFKGGNTETVQGKIARLILMDAQNENENGGCKTHKFML